MCLLEMTCLRMLAGQCMRETLAKHCASVMSSVGACWCTRGTWLSTEPIALALPLLTLCEHTATVQ